MASFHAGWEKEHYTNQLSPRGWFTEKRIALTTVWSLYLGVALTVATAAAPLAPLLFVMVAQGVRSAYDSPRVHALGYHLRRALPVVCLVVLVYGLAYPNQRRASPLPSRYLQRAKILQDLETQGGQHLVIVRYRRHSPRHYPHEEWVYNHADIDAANVVWARDLNPPQNRRLLKHFSDRTPWLLEPDVEEPRLQPYPGV